MKASKGMILLLALAVGKVAAAPRLLDADYLQVVEKRFEATSVGLNSSLNSATIEGDIYSVANVDDYSGTVQELKNFITGDSELFPYDSRYGLYACKYSGGDNRSFKFCFNVDGKMLNDADISFLIRGDGTVFSLSVMPPKVEYDVLASAYQAALKDQAQVEAMVRADENFVRKQFLDGRTDFGSDIILTDLKALGTDESRIAKAPFLTIEMWLGQEPPYVTWQVHHLLSYNIDAVSRTILNRGSVNIYD